MWFVVVLCMCVVCCCRCFALFFSGGGGGVRREGDEEKMVQTLTIGREGDKGGKRVRGNRGLRHAEALRQCVPTLRHRIPPTPTAI